MRPRPALLRLTLAALAGVSALSSARADTITLKDGTVLEGRAVVDGDQVTVYKRGKKRVLRSSDVVSIVTPRQSFRARLAALAAEDLPAHLALAHWAEGQRLPREAKEVRELILTRWPEHKPTRAALGYVRHEGRWILRSEYMRDLGLVESGDRQTWVTPEAKAAAAAKAKAAAQVKEVEALCRSLAGGRTPLPEVAAAVARYEDLAACPALEDALLSESLSVRRFAAEELGRRGALASQARLAKLAYQDSAATGRAAALSALGKFGPTQTRAARAELIRGLQSKSVWQSGHAAGALALLPDRRAVPYLIMRLRESTGGFGVVSMSVVTDRAYIRDFELTSGGSGQQLAEVADPQVAKSTEGVSLEVKVIQWYRESVVTALRRTSGQSFGPDAERWQRWWDSQEGPPKK